MAVIDIGFQTCIMCGQQVEVTSVVKTETCTHVDLDTRPRGPLRHAEKNYVHYCCNCGYANFNLEQDITKGNKEYLDDEYFSVSKEDIFVDGKKFYLVGLLLVKIDEITRAVTSFLRASWFFSDNQNFEWAKKSRLKVIELLVDNPFTWKNAQTALILIDCYRRIEMFSEAIDVIKKFDVESIKDNEQKKLFNFQESLCNNQDSSIHTTKELDETSDK